MRRRVSHTYDMTTHDRSIAEQLPDLPALESAEVGVSAKLMVIAIPFLLIILMAAPLVYLYWRARPFFGDQFVQATFAVALLALLMLWVILRLLSGVFCWKTDAHGLTMRGPLHRRLVAWQDVEDATSEQGAGGLYYRLRTNGGVVHVNVESQYDSPALYASIRQHLRRLGRAGDLQLPETALTFWDRIPDELPTTAHWTNPRPPKLWLPVVTILGVAGFVTWVLVAGGNWYMKGFMAIMGVGFMFIAWSVLRDNLRAARSVSLTDDHIEVQTARGAVILPWAEVTRVRWALSGDQGYDGLLITGRNRSDRVAIPHVLSDEDSGRLILAIIRRLRTAGMPQALSIPEELRAQVGPARIEPQASDSISFHGEPVEVRLTIRERVLIMLLPLLMSIGIFLGNTPEGGMRSPYVSVPIAIGLLALVWLVSGTYVLRADSDGIQKRFLGLGRLIRWDDIAEYSICPVFEKAVRNHRVVKDSNGKVLMEFGVSFGDRKARDRFWAILDSRLTQSWVSAKPAEPWKARPWTVS